MSSHLSKTRFLSGSQCLLKLWYDVHERNLLTPIDAAAQAIFDVGREVGELACKRHPNGRLVDWDRFHFEQAAEETQALMRNTSVGAIFEAAFEFRGVQCRVDILERLPEGGWGLIEVKSTTNCKEVHLTDLAIQHWILRGVGLDVRKAGVLTLNPKYILQKQGLDVNGLFEFHSRLSESFDLQSSIGKDVSALKKMLNARNAPDIQPGDQCFAPYECPYLTHCTRDLPEFEHPIDELPRLAQAKRKELQDLGIDEIRDIPETLPLSQMQTIIRDAVIDSSDHLDQGLASVFDQFKKPVRHLDFETFAPAIPRFVGTSPYQAIPFMFSVHTERTNGIHKHSDYLHERTDDPRQAIAEHLVKELGKRGSICVYSGYEKTCINRLIETVPQLERPLTAILARLVDLLPIVRNHYYHPSFRGSFSIKSVLPVLAAIDYDDLAVDNGQLAAVHYMTALRTDDGDLRQAMFQDLHEYCERDTLATMKVRLALEKLAVRTRGKP